MSNGARMQPESVHPMLKFDPGWVTDPLPWWFREHIRPELLKDLVKAQLQFERNALQARLELLQQTDEILGRMK